MQAYLVLSSARASAGKEAEVQTSVATDGGSRGEEKSSDTVVVSGTNFGADADADEDSKGDKGGAEEGEERELAQGEGGLVGGGAGRVGGGGGGGGADEDKDAMGEKRHSGSMSLSERIAALRAQVLTRLCCLFCFRA
jgi:hypothetical protein